MMTVGEIATAVRYRLPVVFLVNNDKAYGSDYHILELDGFPGDVALSDDVSFERIAVAMGARGMTIETLKDVEQLPRMIHELNGPLVVEYKVTTRVVSDSLGSFLNLSRQMEGEA
jgi:thiamine pyrophosphate-dependent acetolactate synthase large subunit-like protein